MKVAILATLVLMIGFGQPSNVLSLTTNSDTLKVENGILLNFVSDLPISSYRNAGNGIEIYCLLDTNYFDNKFPATLFTYSFGKCLMIQKEAHNYYFTMHNNKIKKQDGTYKSDSLKGTIVKDLIQILSYYNNKVDTIYLYQDATISIKPFIQ